MANNKQLTFENKVAEFVAKKEKFEVKRVELAQEKQELENTVAEGYKRLEEAYLAEIVSDSVELSKQEQNAIKKQIKTAQDELKQIDQRIEAIERAMKNDLVKDAKELRESKNHAISEYNEAFAVELEQEMYKAQFAYLAKVKELAEKRRVPAEIAGKFTTAVKGIVNTEKDYVGISPLNLYNDYSGKEHILGVSQQHVQEVFNNASFNDARIELFVETGEAVKHAEDARKKLKDARKNK